MVPRKTDPLTKFIRTGEGVLVFLFNIALLVVPIVSSSLTAAESAKWATIIDGIAVISRTGLKMVASAQGATPAATTVAPPAPVAVEVAAEAPAAVSNGTPPADVATVPPAQGSVIVTPQVAVAGTPQVAVAGTPQIAVAGAPQVVVAGTDLADMGQLVDDAEEFADPPSAVQSEPDQQPAAALSFPTAGLVGSNGKSAAPFLAQLGE